jgi:HEAT repeat protein
MAVLAGFVLISEGAYAQKPDAQKPAAKKPAAAASATKKVDVAPAIKKIESGEEQQIKEGLDEVRIAGPGGAAAGPAIASVLTTGATLALTMSAIETLADIEAESGSAALADYAVSHRNVKVRRAAAKALARTKGAAAAAALRKALSDSDPVVRGTAASSLGALKAKDAVPDLFIALDHKVNEAAASIGQLCNPDQCDQLAAKLGKLPFDVVSQALDQILFRTADMSEDAKIKVVGRIRELGTIEANKFLRDVQKRWPANGSKRVRQSIDQAVIATSGGTQ